MNPSIFRFSLNFHTLQSQTSVPVFLGDTNVEFRITLSDGVRQYTIEDGCLAKISIKRPTGTRLEDFCTIENNTIIVYSFSQNVNTAAVEGLHECDITLYSTDGGVVGTARFTMVVSEKVVRSDDIVITDEDRTVVDAMLTTEANRQFAENARKEAEDARKAAEDARKESFDSALQRLDNALNATFVDDGEGNVTVSLTGLNLVDVGEGNILMEVLR